MGKYNLTAILEKQRKDRYYRANAIIEKLIKILVDKYRVNKIVVVGSSLSEERFHEHSDIDLCVAGLPNEEYFKALGELLMEGGEFNIDLIPMEDATERMREYINQGKILYEK